MARETLGLSKPLSNFIQQGFVKEHPALARLRDDMATHEMGIMQIAPELGQFLRLLCLTLNARRVLEIGTFTGSSALVFADAVGPEGRVVCLDKNSDWTNTARELWKEAGVADRIDLRLAPALDSLRAMQEAGEPPFDAAFIDADKENTIPYFEHCLQRVRPGGLIIVDNLFRSGRVADTADTDPGVQAMREVAHLATNHDRLDASAIPIADGLLVARIKD